MRSSIISTATDLRAQKRRGMKQSLKNLRLSLDQGLYLLKVPFMSKTDISSARRVVGLLLVAVILFLGLASTYPELHSALHGGKICAQHCDKDSDEDSGGGGHLCGVTLIQIGMLAEAYFPSLNTLGPRPTVLKPVARARGTSACIRLTRSRAPPMVEIL